MTVSPLEAQFFIVFRHLCSGREEKNWLDLVRTDSQWMDDKNLIN
jgi:hypothetical protein